MANDKDRPSESKRTGTEIAADLNEKVLEIRGRCNTNVESPSVKRELEFANLLEEAATALLGRKATG